jgi:hypothetical protein
MLSVTYAKCCKQALYAECYYAGCRYGDCRGAVVASDKLTSLQYRIALAL